MTEKSIRLQIDHTIKYGLIDLNANPENLFGTSHGMGEGAKWLFFQKNCLQVRDKVFLGGGLTRNSYNLHLHLPNPG